MDQYLHSFPQNLKFISIYFIATLKYSLAIIHSNTGGKVILGHHTSNTGGKVILGHHTSNTGGKVILGHHTSNIGGKVILGHQHKHGWLIEFRISFLHSPDVYDTRSIYTCTYVC